MPRIILPLTLALLMVFGSVPHPAPGAVPAGHLVEAASKPRPASRRERSKPEKPNAETITVAGCKIKEKGTSWKLLRDCTPTGTIKLPKDVVFNGQGHTITVTGSVTKFKQEAVISADRRVSAVKNLNIVGTGITDSCNFRELTAMSFDGANGTLAIDRVTITDVQAYGSCGYAIYVSGGAKTKITNSSISVDGPDGISVSSNAIEIANNTIDVSRDLGGFAISVYGAIGGVTVQGNQITLGDSTAIRIDDSENILVDDNTITGRSANNPSGDGVSINGPTLQARISNNTIAAIEYAIDIYGQPIVSIIDNDIKDAEYGVQVGTQSTITATGNEIGGAGSNVGEYGIWFRCERSKGSVTGNTIAQFYCGINISQDAGAVTESGTIFLDNDRNVCDNRP